MKSRKKYESPEIRIVKFDGNEELTFDDNAEISVLPSTEDGKTAGFTVRFPDVPQYYTARGYKVEIYNFSNEIIGTKEIQSFLQAGLPINEFYSVGFTGVPVCSEYTVKVYPLNFFGRCGKPLIKTVKSK